MKKVVPLRVANDIICNGRLVINPKLNISIYYGSEIYIERNVPFRTRSAQGAPRSIQRLGKKKALVVTDKGLIQFGVGQDGDRCPRRGGSRLRCVQRGEAQSYCEERQDGVAAFKASGADLLVAIGGGSAMDTAKGIGIVVANPSLPTWCRSKDVRRRRTRACLWWRPPPRPVRLPKPLSTTS